MEFIENANYPDPEYTFPQDIFLAIDDGRNTSVTLMDDVALLSSGLGYPVALEGVFTSACAQKRALIRHFRRESIHNQQSVVVKESGYSAARALVMQSIATDTCGWILAQKMKTLSPDELSIIDSNYAVKCRRKNRRISSFYRVAMNQYGHNYSGDPKIKALFSIPGILHGNEDKNACLVALKEISSHTRIYFGN